MFLRLPDGALSDHEDRLTAAIRAIDPPPAVVYAPAVLDPHPDHRAANRALAAAELTAPVYGYEVWAAASVDCVLDIGTTWERKARALDCYPSALSVVDYRVSARGLAAYRGVAAGLGSQGLAEGFVRLTPADHTAHTRQIG
jgi:LmbE family N-acetylglucosaminyl deacetylase